MLDLHPLLDFIARNGPNFDFLFIRTRNEDIGVLLIPIEAENTVLKEFKRISFNIVCTGLGSDHIFELPDVIVLN